MSDLYCYFGSNWGGKAEGESILDIFYKYNIAFAGLDKIYSKLNGEDAEPEVESEMEPEPEVNEMSDDTDYDTEGYDYEENIDSLFDETFNDIQTLNDEIVIIHRLVDEIYGYISSDNIRINYYFS